MGSKRQSWKTQRNIYKAIGRELAALAARPPIHTCALPPRPLTRREAEKERLRQIARETLAKEQAE